MTESDLSKKEALNRIREIAAKREVGRFRLEVNEPIHNGDLNNLLNSMPERRADSTIGVITIQDGNSFYGLTATAIGDSELLVSFIRII